MLGIGLSVSLGRARALGEVAIPSYARTFDGINQYFSIADNADVSVGDVDATFFFWVFISSADNSVLKGLIGKGDPFGAGGEYLAWLQNSVVTWAARLGDDSNFALQQNGVVTTPLGEWMTVELIHDATADKLRAYINGVADLGAPDIAGGIFDAANALWIGRNAYGYLKGSLARIGFWKRLLTSDERAWLNAAARRYAALGQPGDDGSDLLTDLVSYWDCEEESGNLLDAHSGNELTANNAPGRGIGP